MDGGLWCSIKGSPCQGVEASRQLPQALQRLQEAPRVEGLWTCFLPFQGPVKAVFGARLGDEAGPS